MLSRRRNYTSIWSACLGAALGASVLVVCNSASAFVSAGLQPWPGGWINYRVNRASFGTDLEGLSLTPAEASYWVRYTLEQWRWRTGAKVFASEIGDTTLGNVEPDCRLDTNGDNFVAALPGCLRDDAGFFNCSILATTANTWLSSSKARVRSIICIHGDDPSGTINWEVDADAFVNGGVADFDLASVLVHEWGHVLGLKHSANAVMNATVDAESRVRYPTDDDIRGIRSISIPENSYTQKIRPVTSTGVGSAFSNGTTQWSVQGAVQAVSGGVTYAIKARPSASGDQVHFTRAALPLSSSSVWTNRSLTLAAGPEMRQGSWVSPSMVYAQNVVLAAWPNKVANVQNCSGITIVRTADAFDSVSVVNENTSCTMNAVALTYDSSSGRFVLFYQHFDPFPASLSERIWARTSNDGLSWSAATDLGIRTVHSPAASATPLASSGALVYAHRGVAPWLMSRSWSLSGSSVLVSGASTTYATLMLMAPTLASTSDRYLLSWSTNTFTGSFLEFQTSPPFSTYDDLVNVHVGLNVPASAARLGSSQAHLFYQE